MDAREKWLERGDALLVEAINSQYHLGQMSGGNCVTMQQAIPSELAFDAIRAHLRTTPEGFALVPVPEWVPFDEFTSYPAPESSGWFWYIKDDEIFRGTAMQVCLARGVTYWCPADNPPAPPNREPL